MSKPMGTVAMNHNFKVENKNLGPHGSQNISEIKCLKSNETCLFQLKLGMDNWKKEREWVGELTVLCLCLNISHKSKLRDFSSTSQSS